MAAVVVHVGGTGREGMGRGGYGSDECDRGRGRGNIKGSAIARVGSEGGSDGNDHVSQRDTPMGPSERRRQSFANCPAPNTPWRGISIHPPVVPSKIS